MPSTRNTQFITTGCSVIRSRHGLAAWTMGIGLCLTSLVAIADNERTVPAATPASAPRATTTTAASVPATSGKSASVTPAADSSGSKTAEPPKVVCFKTSIRCFSTTQSKATGNTPAKSLDIEAPQIAHVFSEQELQTKLPDEQPEEEIHEEVQVEGARQLAPVSVGIMALPWAVLHPTQAWRIFMPLPASETK